MVRNQRVKKAVFNSMARGLTRSYHRIAQSSGALDPTNPANKDDKSCCPTKPEFPRQQSLSKNALLLLLGGRQGQQQHPNESKPSMTKSERGTSATSSAFQNRKQAQSDSDDDHSQCTKHTVLTHEEDQEHPYENYLERTDATVLSLETTTASYDVLSEEDEAKLKAYYRLQVEEDLRRAMEQMKARQMDTTA